VIGTPLMDASAASALVDAATAVLVLGTGGVAVAVGASAVAVTRTVRRVRRSPAVAVGSLRMAMLRESGPRREVVRLRLQLLQALEGGRSVLGAVDTRTGLPGEAPALFRRIENEARTVDQHLRVLQAEDDPATLRAALPALRRRVDELIGLVRQLRAAVAAGLEAASDAAMAELGADVRREVTALQAGRERLKGRDGLPSAPNWTSKGAIR
jgi:hypothetical protein